MEAENVRWRTALACWVFACTLPVQASAQGSQATLSQGDAAEERAEGEAARPARDDATAGAPGGAEAGSDQEPDGKVAEARQRFDRGLQLYRDGDYELALIEFSRAYEIVPDFRVLYNIAQVSMTLGRYAQARRSLEQYLKDGAETMDPARREAVERDLAMLSERTATLFISSNVKGADVVVDEDVIGRTPMASPILLDAGLHTVTLRKPGYLPASERITLAGRDAAERSIELRPVPVNERERIVVERQVDTSTEKEPTVPSLVWAGWIATGALATSAAVTGVLGVSAAGELEDLQNDPDAQRRELNDAQKRADSLFLTADLLTAAALLTGGASLYFTLFTGGPAQRPERDAPPRSASVGVGWRTVNVLTHF